MEFRYIPPDEVAQRHRARNAEAPLRQAPKRIPQQRNVEPILSLGDVRYFAFNNRPYRVPPVPFKQGQRVLDSHVRALQKARDVVATGQQGPSDEYYQEMTRLAKLLWQHIRPTGKFKRMLWRLGLMRNPFLRATEKELKQITDFFLQGRMTSSVQPMSAAGKQL